MPIDPLIQPKFLGTKAAFSTSDISKPKKASQTSGTTTPAPKTYQLSTFTPTKKMVKEADGYYRMHPLDGAKGKPAQSQSASIGSGTTQAAPPTTGQKWDQPSTSPATDVPGAATQPSASATEVKQPPPVITEADFKAPTPWADEYKQHGVGGVAIKGIGAGVSAAYSAAKLGASRVGNVAQAVPRVLWGEQGVAAVRGAPPPASPVSVAPNPNRPIDLASIKPLPSPMSAAPNPSRPYGYGPNPDPPTFSASNVQAPRAPLMTREPYGIFGGPGHAADMAKVRAVGAGVWKMLNPANLPGAGRNIADAVYPPPSGAAFKGTPEMLRAPSTNPGFINAGRQLAAPAQPLSYKKQVIQRTKQRSILANPDQILSAAGR